MGNMSYCRFENTAGDLQDCVTALEEAATFSELDLSSYERDAARRMFKLAKQYVEQYEFLLEEEVGDRVIEEECD